MKTRPYLVSCKETNILKQAQMKYRLKTLQMNITKERNYFGRKLVSKIKDQVCDFMISFDML